MTANDVDKIKEVATGAICGGSLAYAFALLRQLTDEAGDWRLSSRTEECAMLYGQMLIYRYKGAEDPERGRFVAKLKRDMLALLDDVCEMLYVRYSSSYEYVQKRIFGQRGIVGDELRAAIVQSAPKGGDDVFSTDFEALAERLFEYVWLGGEWNGRERDEMAAFVMREDVPPSVRCMAVSALTLNLLHRYDGRKTGLLLSLYDGGANEMKARAAIGVLMVAARHHVLMMNDEGNMRELDRLMADGENMSDMEYAYTQIVRTAENKRVTDRIMTDIMPEMMKASAKVRQEMQDDEDMLNPKWQEMLEESGAADKLREFSELQLSGADVYVSTFSALKSFPFFNHISRWFMAFDRRVKAVAGLFGGEGADVIKVLASNQQLCNSDKYSFFLSIAQMPQERMVQMQMGVAEQIKQMKEDEESERWQSGAVSYKLLVRQYVQDLYRFYNLFPQHKDFRSPLEEALYLYRSPVYAGLFRDVEMRRRLCEFFFEKDCYAQAKEMYRLLQKEIVPDVAFYQKLGFACYKTGDYIGAIENYAIADTLQPDDLWTLNAMAKNYRLAGDGEQYLAYLEKIYEADGENGKVIWRLAEQYMAMGRYEAASRLLFKLDYLTPGEPEVLRKLAESLVNMREFDKAMTYLRKLAEETKKTGLIERGDLLYMGHLCKKRGHDNDAMRCYYKLYAMMSRDVQAFGKLMRDGKTLSLFGLDADEMDAWAESVAMIPDVEQLTGGTETAKE